MESIGTIENECPPELLPKFALGATPTVAKIEAVVAESFGLRKTHMLHRKGRPVSVSWPRQVASYFMRDLAKLTWHQIGAHYGQDHTTAMYSHMKVSELRGCYLKLDKAMEEIRDRIMKGNQK